MSKNEGGKVSSVSQAHTLDDIADYWDSHSLAAYWDELPDVKLEVRALPRWIVVAPELYEKLETQARIQGMSIETLANLWLAERLHEPS